ncbi:hypothetical protein, partial [Escherichia coli]|uniref:hypothetical protein n=1 Tax=Escherichia coli TaxID=562 RepID=UPI001BD64263
ITNKKRMRGRLYQSGIWHKRLRHSAWAQEISKMVSLSLPIIKDVFMLKRKAYWSGRSEASLDSQGERDAENEALIPFSSFCLLSA